jgi:hypothetical protein
MSVYDSRNTTIFGKIPENYLFRPLIDWAIIRLKTKKITEKIIQCNATYITFGRGKGETRSPFYNALGGVWLCRGDMDAYAICGLGHCVFRQYDDLCVEGVFGRCLWAWEKEEESVGRSVLGGRHMSHVTRCLWSFLSVYELHVDIKV